MTLPTANTAGYGSFRGRVACDCLRSWLPVYEDELLRLGVIRQSIDIYQLTGDFGGSAGTHSRGGAADLAQATTTAIRVARNMGAAAFRRDDDPNDGQPDFEDTHDHLVLKGCPHNDPARYQIGALEAGYNGLGYNGRGGRDDGPRSDVRWPLRTWKEGIAWAKARQTPPPPAYINYYVIGPFALGHQDPSATSRRVGSVKPWGTLLRVLKTTTVNGALWGWVDPTDAEGRWYLMANLGKTKPTSKIQRIGELTIGEYNVAAQASGHASTYPKRAPLSAKRMVDGGADVIGALEYGSSVTTLGGKTFLQISDDARKAASAGNLVRVAHGEDWRHLLRQLATTDYVAESGRAWTLPTHVDANGTQIVAAAIVKKGVDVKNGLVLFHFDVNSTAAQLKAQAKETLAIGEAWRREVGIRPWNMTYLGDENDTGSTVAAVFSSWGFVSASTQPGAVGGQYRTTNSWTDALTVGPQRDSTFVPEGSAESWEQWLDAVASDHNYNQAVRAIYGTAT